MPRYAKRRIVPRVAKTMVSNRAAQLFIPPKCHAVPELGLSGSGNSHSAHLIPKDARQELLAKAFPELLAVRF